MGFNGVRSDGALFIEMERTARVASRTKERERASQYWE